MSEEFTFFYRSNNVFSQWYENAPFTVNDILFKTAENWMMYKKGVHFNASQELLDKILKSNARDAKALGRQIPNFNADQWNKVAKLYVKEGNFHKFSQNRNALSALIATEGTTLCESSPSDCIWGCGLDIDNPLILSRENWRGTNWLGEVLTEIREVFLVGFRFGVASHKDWIEATSMVSL